MTVATGGATRVINLGHVIRALGMVVQKNPLPDERVKNRTV